MLAQASIVKNSNQTDSMEDFRTFINGVLQKGKCNPLELTKTSISLLKSLPAAREAIFEYFCTVFDTAAKNYIIRIEAEIATGKMPPPSQYDETMLSEIHLVLSSFVKSNPEAWAPLISTWSLELLGEISSRYEGRAHVSPGLNETLQLWMNCRATRTLIDITTQCLHCLINSNTDACISALLDTSVKHSPNFDWVVAHVGSCFPKTVITRVLSCGLRDFCQNKSYEQGCNSPKLKSVVGILGHLAGSHSEDIQKALLDLFNWSLQQDDCFDDVRRLQRKAAIPFLLQLSCMSSTLLSSVCCNLRRFVSVNMVVQLYNYADDWCKYFGSSESLEDLLVTLILKCEKGGIQAISLLLDCITLSEIDATDKTERITIQEKAQDILDSVLYELDHLTRNHKQAELLKSLESEISDIHSLLLNSDKIRSQTAARIIIYLSDKCPSILINSVSHIFQNSTNPEHLALLVRLLTSELIDKTVSPYSDKGGHFAIVLEQILSKCLDNNDDTGLNQMWENLLTLLRWQKLGTIPALKSEIITEAVRANLTNLTTIFKNVTAHIHLIAEILDLLEAPSIGKNGYYNPPSQVIINFTQAAVNYFFVCCKSRVSTTKFKRVQDILRRLCVHSKVAKIMAFRELLEKSLFRSENVLFGSKDVQSFQNNDSEALLLKQNRKLSKTIPLTRHSSVFNGGIVGSGKRRANTSELLPNETIQANITEFINVIKACCTSPTEPNGKATDLSLESITLISLLLVQFVSPDVMYNGLPWPEEEFSKVTIERDLFIRRMFNNCPLLWDLMNFIAIHRPALCYCSVLLRALTATLMHQWNSMGDQSKSAGTDGYRSLMDTTVKVIDIMALGQLLPPPLSGIRDVLPHLKCFEIVAILRDCVWYYMRDHIPSPALFGCDQSGLHWRDPTVARPPDVYSNTLRIIMQKNISTVGHLYNQLFIKVLED